MLSKMLTGSAVVFFSLVVSTGCASITRGGYDVLEVNTTPIQAEVDVYRLDRGFKEKELKRNLSSKRFKEIKKENGGKDAGDTFAGPISGVTPATFSLARKGEYRLEITKNGYKPATVQIKNKIVGSGAAGMAGNVLVGGFLGAGIDAGTGAMRNLVPNPVEIELERIANEIEETEESPESDTSSDVI